MYGAIRSHWRISNGEFVLDVEIPVNTTATVFVPAGSAEDVTESGQSAKQSKGVEFQGMEGGAAVFKVGSGQYTFTSREGA